MKHTLPSLPYNYNALEPYIDAQTMEIHHTRHHQAYIDKLNTVLEKYPDLQEKKLEDMMKDIDNLGMSDADKTTFRNNGGGHLNHSFFWTIMDPEKKVDSNLVKRIEEKFGSMDLFKEKFSGEGLGRFGSGWVWLAEDKEGNLQLYSTPNQDSPYLQGHTPLLGLDVWEHAYYLKYQNKRPDYIQNWWNLVKII